jgi:hypothetical protein
MRIKRKLLSELIRRHLLREYSEFFGNDFVKFKQRFEKGEDLLSIADSFLPKIGQGSTRIVYGFNDNNSVVLKIINTQVAQSGALEGEDIHGFTKRAKVLSNQWEADLIMQQLYPDIFPRTFEVAKDYSWILSEKVAPLKDFNELLAKINLGDEVFSGGQMGRIQFQAIIEMAIDAIKPEETFAKRLISEIMLFEIENHDPTLAMNPGRPRGPGQNLFKRRIMKVLSDPHLRKMFKAMGELDIPTREFSAKNLGVSELSGKLMLLDASLWKEHKKLR